MNEKFKSFIIKFFHALSANIVRLGITLVLTLVLPKLLGVEDFSYWQLYLFYLTYVAYSSLGWCEGSYLKYGGKDYNKLDSSTMASQFWMLAAYEVLFSIIAFVGMSFFLEDGQKKFILICVLISAFLDILRYLLQVILEATDRVKEYARIVTTERLLFFILAMGFLILGVRDYRVLIFSEIIARFISLIYAVFLCRRIVFAKLKPFKVTFQETRELIGSGYKLLIASLASQMIVGIVRFAIEQKWGTVVFGKISLTLSMSNMMLTCIAAISVVMFPALKRMQGERLVEVYGIIRETLMLSLSAVLIVYVPIKEILSLWLPQYTDSLKYLAILFPVCIYETRNLVLIGTYMKALRKENLILYTNLITVAVSVAVTGITVYVIGSIDIAVVSIVVLMAFKCIISEIFVKRYINIHITKDICLEIILTVIFIVSSWFLQGFTATLLYMAAYGICLLIKKKDIQLLFKKVKQLAAK